MLGDMQGFVQAACPCYVTNVWCTEVRCWTVSQQFIGVDFRLQHFLEFRL